jgi:hypothetical protein
MCRFGAWAEAMLKADRHLHYPGGIKTATTTNAKGHVTASVTMAFAGATETVTDDWAVSTSDGYGRPLTTVFFGGTSFSFTPADRSPSATQKYVPLGSRRRGLDVVHVTYLGRFRFFIDAPEPTGNSRRVSRTPLGHSLF